MATPRIHVALPNGVAKQRRFTFTSDFRIGKHPACEVQILHEHDVSPFHARVARIGDEWWVIDLNGTEATYCHGVAVSEQPVSSHTPVRIGRRGPVLILTPAEEAQADTEGLRLSDSVSAGIRSTTARTGLWLRHHVRDVVHDLRGLPLGSGSRSPYEMAQARRRKWFVYSLGVLAFLLLVAGGHALYQRARIAAQERELAEYRRNARELFYSLKEMDVNYMTLTEALEGVTDPNALNPIKQARRQRGENLVRFEDYVESLGLYDDMAVDERIIHHVLNRFGEFSLDMPPAFADSVRTYIRYWQRGSGFERAIERARRDGLVDRITETLVQHDLPPEFFYMALQESLLDPTRSGPPTRFGHAKGLWQLMPATARRYNLRTGPLTGVGQYDPQDERFDANKSTRAAARHLRTLFTDYVQASGLLVMAAYNWGEMNIVDLTRNLPDTPRERNFWSVLERHGHEIPTETRRYVFKIVAAAVIGENPRLFGFDFDNPLADSRSAFQSVRIDARRPKS